MKCFRGGCEEPGTVLAHQIDAGNMQGDKPGPCTGDIRLCVPHAEEIARQDDTCAWPALASGVTP